MIVSSQAADTFFHRPRTKRRQYAGFGDAVATPDPALTVVPVPGFTMSPTVQGFAVAVAFSVAVSVTASVILSYLRRP